MDTLNGANMAHVRFRISQAEAVADDEDELVLSDMSLGEKAYADAGLVPQQEETERQKTIRATYVDQPRTFDVDTVMYLWRQTSESAIRDMESQFGPLTEAQKGLIDTHVVNNLWKGSSYDAVTGELTMGEDLPVNTESVFINSTNKWLNLKSAELRSDPTVPLYEHKLKPILLQGVADGKMNMAMMGEILGIEEMRKTGLLTEDLSDAEYEDQWEATTADFSASNRNGLRNVLSRVTNQIDRASVDHFSKASPGDFSAYIRNDMEKNPYTYVGPIPSMLTAPDVNLQKLLTDSEYLKSTINGWVSRKGGIEKPSDAIDPRTNQKFLSHEQGALRTANEAVQNSVIDTLSGFINERGTLSQSAQDQAALEGITPDQWIADQLYSQVGTFFDPDTEGNIEYHTVFARQSEANRRYNYSKSPGKIKTELEAALRFNPEYWVNGLPVEMKSVPLEMWAQWEQMYANNHPDTALAMISNQLEEGVRASFRWEDAEKQAKALMARDEDPVTWSDISDIDQNSIITNIQQRGGIDLDTAFTEGGVDSSFASELIGFARTGIEMGEAAERERDVMEEFADVMGSPTNRTNAIMNMAVQKGIISEDTSPEYLQYFTSKIAPRLSQKAALSGAMNMTELQDKVTGYIDELPAYERYETDYQRQLAPTEADVLSGAALPPGVDPRKIARPIPGFDVSAFTPELMEMAFDRPELAGFVQQQMQVPGFEQEWQKAAQRKVTRDRGADISLQENRLASFQSAYDRAVAGGDESVIAQAQANLDSAQAQFSRETGAVKTTVAPSGEGQPGMFRPEPLTRRRISQEERERAVEAGQLEEFAETAGEFERRKEQARLQVEQNLRDMAKMKTTAGMTQQQFFESKMPGFQERFEASPFFRQEQERLEGEEEQRKLRSEQEERAAESRRRGRLRGGAMTVFGRRE